MYAAWDGARRLAAGERQAREELKSVRIAFAKSQQESKALMEKTMNEMQTKVDEAKTLYAEKDRTTAERINELEGKVTVAESRADKAEEKLQSAEKLLSEEKISRTKTEAVLSSLEKKCKAAEDAVAAAKKRSEDLAAETQTKIGAALVEYKDSREFWAFLTASYDQGCYHMARCLWRAAEQNKTPTLQDLAEWTQENAFSEELVRYHPVIPFSATEMVEYNEDCRKQGLPEVEFPTVVTPNMRAFQEELEKKRTEAEEAAARAEEAEQLLFAD